MKKTFYIKEVLLQVTFITVILLIANTRNIQSPLETMMDLQKQNALTFDSNNPEKDSQFIVNSTETHQEVIQLDQFVHPESSTR